MYPPFKEMKTNQQFSGDGALQFIIIDYPNCVSNLQGFNGTFQAERLLSLLSLLLPWFQAAGNEYQLHDDAASIYTNKLIFFPVDVVLMKIIGKYMSLSSC